MPAVRPGPNHGLKPLGRPDLKKICVLFANPASIPVMNMKTNTIETVGQDEIRTLVRARYGEIAQTAATGTETNTRSGGCCGGGGSSCGGSSPETLGYEPGAAASTPEGAELGLGCGNPLALASIKPGETIVDLGSGGGFDCFLAARQTGPTGRVIGVDMTPEMISRARKNAAQGGFANVEFRLGEIENLPVADATGDLLISNCVINLSPDKARVFAEAWRVLKSGGRISISDVVATAAIPDDVRRDLAAYTGCIAGAASVEEVRAMLTTAGFKNVRITLNEASRAFINDWAPGHRAGDYVVSALIEAVK